MQFSSPRIQPHTPEDMRAMELLESPVKRYRGHRVTRSPSSSVVRQQSARKQQQQQRRASDKQPRPIDLFNARQDRHQRRQSNDNNANTNDNDNDNDNDNNSDNDNSQNLQANQNSAHDAYAKSLQSLLHNDLKTSFLGDRFIPCRTSFDVDIANYNLRKHDAVTHASLDTSPAKEEYKRTLGRSLFGAGARRVVLPLSGSTIIENQERQSGLKRRNSDFGGNATLVKAAQRRDRARRISVGGGVARERLLDTSRLKQGAPQRKCHRTIPRTPLRILDAPDMLEDYYLNLLDWNKHNVLAVALDKAVYLWNAGSGDITKLTQLAAPDSYIASLKWSPSGECLAIGTSQSDVQLWDCRSLKRIRSLRDHQGRVSVMAWHDSTLATGSRDALVRTHDVRSSQHIINTLSRHTQEVCGLAYSADGLLASGGNDNLLNIWDPARSLQPRHCLDHHVAAVKGLAWCPWQSGLLASGGGTADRTLRFWDSSSGACLNSIDTKSQVCSIIWSPHYKELVSSHGFSQNQLIVWKYPTMVKVCELTGHTSRVLHMSLSPDGETVVSGSGDETLRFWRLFERRRAAVDKSAMRGGSALRLPSMRVR